MMTGKVSWGPKNAYLSVAGSGFNSSVGGVTKDGVAGSLDRGGSDSNRAFYGGKSDVEEALSKTFTSSTDPSISKFSNPK